MQMQNSGNDVYPSGKEGMSERGAMEVPASEMQQLFWQMQQANPSSRDYLVIYASRIHGPLDIPVLQEAIDRIADTQPTLRTVFIEYSGQLFRRILPSLKSSFVHKRHHHPEPIIKEVDVRLSISELITEAFDLEHGPLIRICVESYDDGCHHLKFAMHHIISDAGSMVRMLQSLSACYNELSSGFNAKSISTDNYASRNVTLQSALLSEDKVFESSSYWLRKLKLGGLSHRWPAVETPDRNSDSLDRNNLGQILLELNAEFAEAISSYAKQLGMSRFRLLLGSFFMSLQKQIHGEAVTVGIPIDTRRYFKSDPGMGCLINMLPVTMEAQVPDDFEPYLMQAGKKIEEAIGHGGYPYIQMIDEWMSEGKGVRSSRWKTMFNVKPRVAGQLALNGTRIEELHRFLNERAQQNKSAELSVTIELDPHGPHEPMQMLVQYDCHAISSLQASSVIGSWITELARCTGVATHLREIVRLHEDTDNPMLFLSISKDGEKTQAQDYAGVNHLPPSSFPEIMKPARCDTEMSSQEKEQIRALSGRHHVVPYPKTTLHQIFQETAERYPDRPAVISPDGTQTSYAQLQAQANQVAAFLRKLGIEKEAVVATHLQRSPALLASMLGILEAGGAFLLIEPSLPLDRLRTMAEQAQVAFILSEDGMPPILGFEGKTHPYCEALASHAPLNIEEYFLSDPHDLAYVMFTSGSTGKPKGAMVTHQNIINRLSYSRDALGFGMDDRALQKSPLSFDVCLTELLLPMFTGGAVALAAPDSEADPARIADQVVALGASYLHFVPGVLKAFLQVPGIEKVNACLRMIRCGGESLPEDLMQQCLATLNARLYQSYGPAETAVAVTLWHCHSSHGHPKPPIGRPNANVDILLMDTQGKPVPPGMLGELWIGGDQTGRGYINNPEETSKRFVDDPLEPGSGRRYYRTGDLARFLPDGNLLFLGRLDDQVKVRGVRIEIGDVSAAILRCAGINEAVVVAEPDGEGSHRLRAWVTAEPGQDPSEASIRTGLAQRLPAYMIPFRIHLIDAIPLTPHGKTDHRALRALGVADDAQVRDGLPLSTSTQHRLAQLWSQLLRVEVTHADADFFRLGGHSLHLMRLLQSIRHVWGVSPDLQTLLEASSLEDMAARIDAHRHPSDQHAAGVPTTLRLWEADGTGGMYFCDGGLGNNVRIVKTLATRQGWTWNTYHIPTPHLHPVGSGETSLEAITERYVETILDVHVDGPIVLVGFCLAGLEAHATACRLQQTSPHPVHLILIDTVHPDGLAMPGRIDPNHPDADTGPENVTRHIGVREPTMDIDALEGIGREAVARGILDPEWYLHRNPDVADAGVDPAIHYLAEGWREGRLPSPWFHADTYALLEPGFRAQHPDPVRHFLNVGMQRPSTHRGILGMATRWKQMEKGDVPHRIFDADWHLARYPEIADGPYPPLTHYVLHGWAEHRTPALHFDKWVYHAICRSFDPFRHNPVLHYLLIGQYDPVVEKAVRTLTSSQAEAEALVAGGWFEPEAYARRYADTRLLRRPGLDHFMSIGWRYGRSPFTGYDPDAFARQFPGFIPGQQNPLRHLLELGCLPIRVGTSPETERTEASPTSDLAPSPLNSATIASNPPNASVAQEEMGPAEREFLVALGRIRKGYRPAFFSGRIYLCANQHLHNVDPLLGWTEGLHGHIQSHPLRGGHDTILGDDLEANADIFRSILEGILASTA